MVKNMMSARVWRVDSETKEEILIMDRQFNDPDLTLQALSVRVEMYVEKEGLNQEGECLIRVRHGSF